MKEEISIDSLALSLDVKPVIQGNYENFKNHVQQDAKLRAKYSSLQNSHDPKLRDLNDTLNDRQQHYYEQCHRILDALYRQSSNATSAKECLNDLQLGAKLQRLYGYFEENSYLHERHDEVMNYADAKLTELLQKKVQNSSVSMRIKNSTKQLFMLPMYLLTGAIILAGGLLKKGVSHTYDAFKN